MSGPVRSVLLLCWRDTGHPQGGGSETYLQRIGSQLAGSGIDVTLRTARYDGAARSDVLDGVRISRGGGRHTVYIRAGLAMVAARIGLGPLRHVRPDVVIDSQNGLPFLAGSPSAAGWCCWCTTATASNGRSPAGTSAGSAGSLSRVCRRGCTAAIST